jgi:hypothetical protein
MKACIKKVWTEYNYAIDVYPTTRDLVIKGLESENYIVEYLGSSKAIMYDDGKIQHFKKRHLFFNITKNDNSV